MRKFINANYPLIVGVVLTILAVYIGQSNQEANIVYILICHVFLLTPFRIVNTITHWENALYRIYRYDSINRAKRRDSLRSYYLTQTFNYAILSILVLMLSWVISGFWGTLLILSWGILSERYVKECGLHFPTDDKVHRVINRF